MKRVRELRRERGMTLAELAELSGVTLTTVANVELGRHSPQLATLERLADALGVSVGDLFEGPAPKEEAPQPWEARLRALSNAEKTSVALAAKSVETDLWLSGTTKDDLQNLNVLEAELGVSSEEILAGLVAESPGLSDVLDWRARKAAEDKETGRTEVLGAIERKGA